MNKFLFALFAALFSVNASAEDFYWRDESGRQGATPYELCQKIFDAEVSNYSGSLYTDFEFEVLRSSDVLFYCKLTAIYNSSGPKQGQRVQVQNYPMHRKGDSCPAGTEYNSQAGECEALPPECPEGDLFPVRGPDSPVINSGGRNYVATGEPPTACYNQCRYVSDNGRAASCYLVPGSTDTGFCNYVLKSNGENCPADDYRLSESGDPLNPPDTPDVPPSDPNDPGCPSGWSWSGTTCVKTDGGDSGDGGGSGGDGGSPGDGGGSGGSGGDGGSPGDDEQPGNSGKSSANCDVRPSYSGDPLLGEILVQQWHTLCAGEELTSQMVRTGLQGEGFIDADTLDNVLARDAENLDDKVSSIISGLYTSGPSSNCPLVDSSVSTPWGVIRIPWAVNCPIFHVISAVIFFFSYLAAGWIVFNALARDD